MSGLLGYILGALSIVGIQAIATPDREAESGRISSFFQAGDSGYKQDHAFHGLKENRDGDVVITKTGDCYHSPFGCSALSHSHHIRTVSQEDAEAAGMTACTKCNP